MRKSYTIAGVLLLLCAVVFAAGTVQSADSRVTVEYMLWFREGIRADDPVKMIIDERFNVDFQTTVVLGRDYDAALTARIAAGDSPNLYREREYQRYRALLDADRLVNISQKALEYGLSGITDYYSDMPGMEAFRERDGYYRFPNYKGPLANVLWVRQDWVEALGLSWPRTLDEFTELLREIVRRDPGGTRPVGFTAYGGVGQHMQHIVAGFTGPHVVALSATSIVQDNGVWTLGQVLPTFREALVYLRRMAAEGLLDREVYATTASISSEKFARGRVVAMFGQEDHTLLVEDQLLAVNPSAKLGIISPMPLGPSGYPARAEWPPYYGYAIVPRDQSDLLIRRTLQVLDFINGPERQELLFDLARYNYYPPEQTGHLLRFLGDYFEGRDRWKESPRESYAVGLSRNLGYVIDHFDEFAVEDLRVQEYFTPVAQDVMPELDSVVQDFVPKFIFGNLDPHTDWQLFVNALERAGMSRILKDVHEYMSPR